MGRDSRDAENALDQAGITTNKNPIPFDQKPPKVTSGLRLGSPAMTTRGFGPDEMGEVAALVAEIIHNPASAEARKSVKARVGELCAHFPLYPNLETV